MKMLMKIFTYILCAMFFVQIISNQAFASAVPDLSQKPSLTITYEDNDVALEGAEFDIYLVARMTMGGGFTLSDAFSDMPVDLGDLNIENLQQLASTLEIYTLNKQIEPTGSDAVGSNGQVTFEDLEPGLYLVLGKTFTFKDSKYNAKPFLLSLPYTNESDGQWIYDAHVLAKFTMDTSSDEFVERKVLKVWKDTGNESKRPANITVSLLRNGEVYDTVLLSKENNWKYSWKQLSADDTWTVIEDVPAGYTVTIVREGITFVVTNTKPPDTPPPPPDNPPDLPQTGQLWWPVPILGILGLLMIIAGLFFRRGAGDES